MPSSGSQASSQKSKKTEGKRHNRAASSNTKEVSWTEITDPEERRRVQNRIAQRKFREKTKETKERFERDSQNQEHAGNSYRIPLPSALVTDSELSGLPWGSMNLGHIISRGIEAEGQRSSDDRTYAPDEALFLGSYSSTYDYTYDHSPSYAYTNRGGSHPADEMQYDNSVHMNENAGYHGYYEH